MFMPMCKARDLGRVSDKVTKVVNELRPKLAPGNTITVRGQVESMNTAFSRLGLGLIFAAVLVYFLMVVNFQSWTRSVHHHHGAPRRVRRHFVDALSHAHHVQRAEPDGRDHEHRRRHREQDPDGHVRERTTARRQDRARRRDCSPVTRACVRW